MISDLQTECNKKGDRFEKIFSHVIKKNMTSINKRLFQLDEPNYIGYDRQKQDYLRIAPTTGTANNLNQGGNIISFESNNHINFLYLPGSFVYCEFHFSNQDGTAVSGNITLEQGWPTCGRHAACGPFLSDVAALDPSSQLH